MKAISAGFLLGISAVLIAIAIVRPARAAASGEPEEAESPPKSAESGSTIAAAPGDLASLRTRAAVLRAENARLAASAGLPHTSSANASAGTARRRRPRAEFGADVFRAYGADSGTSIGSRVRMELALFEGEIAERDGVSPSEARLSPDILEEVMLGMRESCTSPPGETESQALRGALEDYRSEWEEWRTKRDGEMSFDRAADLLERQVKVRDAMYATLSPDTVDQIRNVMENMDSDDWGLYADTTSSSRDALADQWAVDLGLDPSTSAALRPAADEYMLEELAYQKDRSLGDDGPPGTASLRETIRQAKLLSKAQGRIRNLGVLTKEQQARLATWWKTYELAVPGHDVLRPTDGEDR